VPSGPLRHRYLRWMVYLAANNYMTALRFYYPDRHTTAQGGADGVKAAAVQRASVEWTVFAEAVDKGPYVLGENMSAADIYAVMLMSWDLDMEALFKAQPALSRLYAAVAAHPKIAPIWLRHEMPD
jgi:glutathione S-transferase